MKWLLRILGGLAALVVLLILGAALLVGTAPGTRWLVETVLDGVDEVRVAEVEGTLLDRLTVHGVEVADSAGTWLTIGTATMDWRPARLLGGRLWVDLLAARDVHVARAPEAADDQAPAEEGGFDLELLERLTLRTLEIEGVHLAEPVLGAPVDFRLAGHVTGTESGGVDSLIEAERLDAPGEARVEVRHRPGGLLGIHLAAFEPEGGAVARLLDLPGLPAVRLTLNGEGPVDDWDGALLAEAEDFVTIEADLDLSAAAPARALTVSGTAQPGSLMPAEISALTGETLEFAATLREAGENVFAADALRLRGAGWGLDGSGRVGLGELTLSAQAALEITDGTALSELAGVPIGQGRAEVRAEGPFDRLDVALDAEVTDTVVQRAQVRAQAVVGGEAIPFSAEGRVEGLAAVAPEADALVGEGVDFQVTATARPDAAEIAVDRLTLNAPGLAADYSGTVALEPLLVAGTVRAEVADLSVLEPVTGVALRGGGTVAADLQAGEEGVGGDVRIQARDFATGIAQADALLAGQVDAAARVDWAGEDLRLSNLRLQAPGAGLEGAVTLRSFEGLEGTFVLAAPELGRLDLPVTGAARAEGTLGGTLAAPVLTARVTGRDVMAAGLDIRQPAATVRVTGERVELADVAAQVAGAEVGGGLALPFDTGLLSGQFSLRMAAADDLAALAGQPITGALNADVVLRPVDGTQGLSVTLNGESVALPEAGVAVRALRARAELSDVFGAPDGRVEATLSDGEAGPVAWQTATLGANLTDGGGAFTVALRGGPTAPYEADAAGHLDMGEVMTVRLDRLGVAGRGHAVRLAAPTAVAFGDGVVSLEPARLSVDGGRLDLEARVGDGRMFVAAEGQALPLAALEIIAPDYPVRGTVALSARLEGPLDGPSGRLQLGTSPLTLPDADVEGLVIEAQATIGDGRLDGQARFSGIAPQPATAVANVPLVFSETGVPSVPGDRPISLSADWRGPVQAIWALVPQVGHRVTGQAVVQGRMTGTLDAPEFSGEASLRNGSYENLEWGTVLRELQLDAGLSPSGDISLQATASDGGTGRVTVEGAIDNSQPGDSQAYARVSLRQVQAVRRDDLRAGISGDVVYEGSLSSGTVRGDLQTETVRLSLGIALGGGVPELNVVEVGQDEETGAVTVQGQAESAFGSDIALDVRVRMPNRVYVTGQGLDSEWQGDLAITGTLADTRINGALQVVRGTFSALNRTFVLESGQVEFTGGEEIDPNLALRAVHETSDITAIVVISGTAQAPEVSLESRPSLPEDEIISRVLFGRGLGELGPGEALAVAQMVGQMAGIGEGPGIMDRVRGALALDVLSVGGGADGPTVEAGRYITEDVYVGVERGAGADSTSVEVEVEIAPNVTVGTRGSARSGADIGVEWKFDY